MDRRSYWTIGRGFAAAMLLIAAQSASAASAAAQEAQTLMDQGKFDEALKKLEGQLKTQPQDAEARFLRGLVLVRLNRGPEAIKVFADLTRDYPQLPEPYNNLAVLYAQQGDYEKARDALEAALATHPAYATAHENLGDIYAALAGAAYNRALALDSGNQAVRTKLALIGQLDATGKTAAVAASPAASIKGPPVAAPAVAIKPAPEPASEPAAEPASSVNSETQTGVTTLLDSWSGAWSSKNLTSYFATYSPDFVPEGGISRSVWEEQRRDRISKPKRIKVKAVNPKISSLGDGKVSVTFLQDYDSDSFKDKVSKTLELQETGSGWLIVREYSR